MDDVKIAGIKQNMAPMWNDEKNVDLDEPTSYLDHVYLGCTHHEYKPNETVVDEFREMFESRIFTGATEKIPGCEKQLRAKTVAWSYDMEGHAQKCVERNREMANKKTEQLHKVSNIAWMIIGELSKVCSQIFLKSLYLARIGRPDIPWSVNKLARSVTDRTQVCDKCIARLISYIHKHW